MRRLAVFLVLSLLLVWPSIAQPKRFHIDRLHSSVTFSLRYLGIIDLNGRAADYYGTFLFDEANVAESSIKVVIRAASLDTAMRNRDRDLHSAQYLDVDRYPAIIFSSTGFRQTADGYIASGTLTIRDVTQPVDLPFQILDRHADDRGEELVLSAGPITIKRTDFGVGTISRTTTDRLFLGDEVTITILLRLTEERADERQMRTQYPEVTLTELELEAAVGTYQSAGGTLWHIERFGNELAYGLRDAAVFRRLIPVGPSLFLTESIGSLMKIEDTPTGRQMTYRLEQDSSRHSAMQHILTWADVRRWLMRDGAQAAITRYEAYAARFPGRIQPFSESEINALGYSHVRQEQYTDALAVFQINSALFPQSGNAFDSLGEAYLLNGDTTQAIQSYQEAIRLDPSNQHAQEVLNNFLEKQR